MNVSTYSLTLTDISQSNSLTWQNLESEKQRLAIHIQDAVSASYAASGYVDSTFQVKSVKEVQYKYGIEAGIPKLEVEFVGTPSELDAFVASLDDYPQVNYP